MKRHVFLDTHDFPMNGQPSSRQYLTADPDLAYSWDIASKQELTESQKLWFRKMADHELGEKTLMHKGIPLMEPSSWSKLTENYTDGAHYQAPTQPGTCPGLIGRHEYSPTTHDWRKFDNY